MLSYTLSTNGDSYSILKHDLPLNVNGFFNILKFKIKRSMANQSGKLICLYNRETSSHHVISTTLSIDHINFPLDCFHEDVNANKESIYMFTHQSDRYEIHQDNKSNSRCCNWKLETIAVHNSTKLETNGR